MDVLSDVIACADVRASLYFRAELSAPFSVAVPADARHLRFHVATQPVWIGLESGESATFGPGDLVLVPHGRAHTLASATGVDSMTLDDLLAQAVSDRVGEIRLGNGDDTRNLVCGHFAFTERFVHPIVAALPPLVHLQRAQGFDFSWLDAMLSALAKEQFEGQPGQQAVMQRLSETIIVQVLRAWLQVTQQSPAALAALSDRHLRPVLEAVHVDPGYSWSLERMAERASLSRSAFAEHFRAAMGVPPMRYVSEWRMQKAAGLLNRPGLAVADVASAVGYRSDAAFAHAFRDFFGKSPSDYRRAAEAAQG